MNFSNWRAVAFTHYGDQHLLYLGMSFEQVRKNYPGAFYELLTAEEQIAITKISLEKWVGKPSRGYWIVQDNLKVPRVHKVVKA